METMLLGANAMAYVPLVLFYALATGIQTAGKRVSPVLAGLTVAGYWAYSILEGSIGAAGISLIAAAVVAAVMLLAVPGMSRFTLVAIPTSLAAAPALGGLIVVVAGLLMAAIVAAVRRALQERRDVLTPAVMMAVRDVQTLTPAVAERTTRQRFLIAPWLLLAALAMALVQMLG